MGRGNTENCAAAWDAATCRTARHHETRQHRELRAGMERGHMENCAAPRDAATQRTETIWPPARHHGTRQHRELRPFGRTRGTMGRGNIQVRGTMERGSMRVRGNIENLRPFGRTRGIQVRGTTDERKYTSARQHYESAAARVRGTTYAWPHSCAAAYMNAAP